MTNSLYKKLLVLTDFSSHANSAVQIAIDIAKKTDAEIHLLHYFAVPLDWGDLDPLHENLYPTVNILLDQVKRQLSDVEKRVQSQGVPVQKYLSINEGMGYINDYITAHHIDLVFMGIKGDGILNIGSFTTKVLHLSTTPVMIVNSYTAPVTFDRITYCTNFATSEKSTLIAIQQVAEQFKSHLDAIYVNTPSSFQSTGQIKNQKQGFFNEGSSISIQVIDEFTIEAGIAHYCEEQRTNLIALNIHPSGYFSQLFSHALVEKVSQKTTIPILCFPLKK